MPHPSYADLSALLFLLALENTRLRLRLDGRRPEVPPLPGDRAEISLVQALIHMAAARRANAD